MINLLGDLKSQAEQFSLLHHTSLQTHIAQSGARLAEAEEEIASLQGQLVTAQDAVNAAQSTVAERDASLALAANQIAELQQRIAATNAAIDAAQGQA